MRREIVKYRQYVRIEALISPTRAAEKKRGADAEIATARVARRGSVTYYSRW